MRFCLTDEYRFWWPVTVLVPDPVNAGAILEQSFEAEFLALDDDDATSLGAAHADAPSAAVRESRERDIIGAVLKNWRGVDAGDGSEVPFSAEALARCARFAWFRIGVYRAYAQAMRGEAAKRKN